MATERSNASIHVHVDCEIIYILVESRAAFDAIPLPASDIDFSTAGKGQSKSLMTKLPYIIFQYWGD